jgi:hypothetical protein
MPRHQITATLVALYAGLFVAQLITLGQSLISDSSRISSAFLNDNLALFLGSFGLVWLSKRSYLTWLGILGVLLALIIGAKMAYRSLLLIYPLTIGLIFVTDLIILKRYGIRFTSIRRLLTLLLVGCFAAVIVWLFHPSDITFVIRRFSLLEGGISTDASLLGRFYEAQTVLDLLKRGGLETLLAGYGFGAQYELPLSASLEAAQLYASQDYQVHNIHIFYLAVLFRSGLIGTFFWFVFQSSVFLALLFSFRKAIMAKDKFGTFLTIWALLYSLLILILATQFSLIERDITLAILVSLSGLYGAIEPDNPSYVKHSLKFSI